MEKAKEKLLWNTTQGVLINSLHASIKEQFEFCKFDYGIKKVSAAPVSATATTAVV